MKYYVVTLLCTVYLFSLTHEAKAQQVVEKDGIKIPIFNFEQIEPLLNPPRADDTTYIFNFWATYCAPCIKELPHFERINSEYADRKVKVILVSLDFKSQIETGVIPFIIKRELQSKVIVLSDPDANTWIDKVSKSWTGAIPATLFVKGKSDRKEFYEKQFTYDELKNIMDKFDEL